MAEKRRTFHVSEPRGFRRSIVLRSTAPGYWRTDDGNLFQYIGHTWLGPKGGRYRIEKWLAPTVPGGAHHTDRTFTSLQSALNAWVRATRPPTAVEEKKTAAQLDAEIAEALAKDSR